VPKDHEGHSGWKIAVIEAAAKGIITADMRPNLVLLNAGTNDCVQNDDTDNAPARMDHMLDVLFNGMPGVAVVLSTVLPNANRSVYDCAKKVNRGYRDIAARRAADGQKIVLADTDDGFITTADIGTDGTHPTDGGYKKLAAVWYSAIRQIASKIEAPAVTGMRDDKQSYLCQKERGKGDGPHKTQAGSGTDDGGYKHISTELGTFNISDSSMSSSITYKNIYFAQLLNPFSADRGGELDDLVIASSENPATYHYFQNTGSGTFGSAVAIDPKQGCTFDGKLCSSITRQRLKLTWRTCSCGIRRYGMLQSAPLRHVGANISYRIMMV
jgi:hypothetical protein